MINNTLDIVANSSDSKELSGFQQLWNKIEQGEQRNINAEIKVDKLYADYQSTLLPYEKQYGASHCRLVAHLLSFVPSRDLKNHDREDLFEALGNHFEQMDYSPYLYDAQEVEKLRKETDNYIAQYFSKERKQAIDSGYDEVKEMLNMAFGEAIDLPDEALKEAIAARDFSKIDALLEEAKKAYMDKQSQDEGDGWNDFEFNYCQDEENDSSKVTEIFKASQLTRMYKKIANIIHPDKEQDPLKKDERHKQMQLLLEAKKEADVFALIKMYREFVPDGEYFLDDNAMVHIEHLLQMRIQKLNQVHRDIFSGQGHKSHVWKSYSATSRKKSLEKMQQHTFEIKHHIATMENKIKALDSVKKIKQALLRHAV